MMESHAIVIPEAVRLLVAREHGECIVAARMESEQWKAINRLEEVAATCEQKHCPVSHAFLPGVYVRQIFMPADTVITSKVHMFLTPYLISQGIVSVWEIETGWRTHEAPFCGITQPATRRVLYTHTDTIWTTLHSNPKHETDPEKLMDELTFDHMNIGHMAHVTPEQMASMRRNQNGQMP
jgi:hypothetical protein